MSSFIRDYFEALPLLDQESVEGYAAHNAAEQDPGCNRQQHHADTRQNDAFVGRSYAKKVIQLLALIPVGGSNLAKRVVKHQPQSQVLPRAKRIIPERRFGSTQAEALLARPDPDFYFTGARPLGCLRMAGLPL